MYDVIYAAEIALCNINKLPLQLKIKNSVWDSKFELQQNDPVNEVRAPRPPDHCASD
jgi:hypothetical protein